MLAPQFFRYFLMSSYERKSLICELFVRICRLFQSSNLEEYFSQMLLLFLYHFISPMQLLVTAHKLARHTDISVEHKLYEPILNFCRILRNVTSNSIKPWYHCPRDGGRAEIHKKIIFSKLIKGRFNFGGAGVLLQNICLTL